jgi:hypothetical protein
VQQPDFSNGFTKLHVRAKTRAPPHTMDSMPRVVGRKAPHASSSAAGRQPEATTPDSRLLAELKSSKRHASELKEMMQRVVGLIGTLKEDMGGIKENMQVLKGDVDELKENMEDVPSGTGAKRKPSGGKSNKTTLAFPTGATSAKRLCKENYDEQLLALLGERR